MITESPAASLDIPTVSVKRSQNSPYPDIMTIILGLYKACLETLLTYSFEYSLSRTFNPDPVLEFSYAS